MILENINVRNVLFLVILSNSISSFRLLSSLICNEILLFFLKSASLFCYHVVRWCSMLLFDLIEFVVGGIERYSNSILCSKIINKCVASGFNKGFLFHKNNALSIHLCLTFFSGFPVQILSRLRHPDRFQPVP